jgi:hypothetical protein
MLNVNEIVDQYVAVWNETNPEKRRERICSLWSPEGMTCNRLTEARGYDAIVARATASWERWLREGKYKFRPKRDAVLHHNVLRVNWEMYKIPGGEVESLGLSYIVLTLDGHIEADYQFNPTANDATDLLDRYLAAFNESDMRARRDRVAKLWARDGAYINAESPHAGQGAIESHLAKTYATNVAKGFRFRSANACQAHHNFARLKWDLVSERSGKITAAGSDLLIFDQHGQIQYDYEFDDPV